MLRCVHALGVILCLVSVAVGEAPRIHDVTVDDYFTLATVTQVTLSPDGKHVAYLEARWQKATNDRRADLCVIDTASGKTQRLTDTHPGYRGLRWGADNQTLYCLGNHRREGDKTPPYNGTAQVWKLPRTGGQPVAVTLVEGGIDAFDLSADGRTLFYSVKAKAADRDAFTHLREKYKTLEYGHGSRRVSQLWKLDLETGQATKLLDARRFIHEFSVTRDGKRVALITTPDDKVITFEGRSRIDILEVEGGKVHTLPDKLWRADAPSPYAWLDNLAW